MPKTTTFKAASAGNTGPRLPEAPVARIEWKRVRCLGRGNKLHFFWSAGYGNRKCGKCKRAEDALHLSLRMTSPVCASGDQ